MLNFFKENSNTDQNVSFKLYLFIIFILSGLGVSNNVSSPLYSFLIRFILFIVAFLWLFKDMLKK